jgi:hypothetical protein
VATATALAVPTSWTGRIEALGIAVGGDGGGQTRQLGDVLGGRP